MEILPKIRHLTEEYIYAYREDPNTLILSNLALEEMKIELEYYEGLKKEEGEGISTLSDMNILLVDAPQGVYIIKVGLTIE